MPEKPPDADSDVVDLTTRITAREQEQQSRDFAQQAHDAGFGVEIYAEIVEGLSGWDGSDALQALDLSPTLSEAGTYRSCALCQPGTYDHPQRHLVAAGFNSCVDELMVPLLVHLWSTGCRTKFSCQGESGMRAKRAYVIFADGRPRTRWCSPSTGAVGKTWSRGGWPTPASPVSRSRLRRGAHGVPVGDQRPRGVHRGVTELDLLLAAEEYRRGFYTVGDDSSTDDLAEDDFDEVDD